MKIPEERIRQMAFIAKSVQAEGQTWSVEMVGIENLYLIHGSQRLQISLDALCNGVLLNPYTLQYDAGPESRRTLTFCTFSEMAFIPEASDLEDNDFDEDTTKEIISILNDSLKAWEIMATIAPRVFALQNKHPESEQLKAAMNHASQSYEQEINGMRDHLKMAMGTI